MESVEIPQDRINIDTLRKMIEEFVTREWSELTDFNCTPDEKIEQGLRQLKERRSGLSTISPRRPGTSFPANE